MPVLELTTLIKADINIVFDLSRSIEYRSSYHINQTLTSKITKLEKPSLFIDEQENGIFKYFTHEHHFKSIPW